jgi:hypothetical protein
MERHIDFRGDLHHGGADRGRAGGAGDDGARRQVGVQDRCGFGGAIAAGGVGARHGQHGGIGCGGEALLGEPACSEVESVGGHGQHDEEAEGCHGGDRAPLGAAAGEMVHWRTNVPDPLRTTSRSGSGGRSWRCRRSILALPEIVTVTVWPERFRHGEVKFGV